MYVIAVENIALEWLVDDDNLEDWDRLFASAVGILFVFVHLVYAVIALREQRQQTLRFRKGPKMISSFRHQHPFANADKKVV